MRFDCSEFRLSWAYELEAYVQVTLDTSVRPGHKCSKKYTESNLECYKIQILPHTLRNKLRCSSFSATLNLCDSFI